MNKLRLVIRWSWRDLRANWAKVLAIAVVIAIGTGSYASMTSNANWRRISYDASYAELHMYDLRVDLATGASAEEGTLAAALGSIDHADLIEAIEERLLVPTQVEASTPDGPVIVRGEITGSDFSGEGPHVNGYAALTGRLLDAADSGKPAVMVERNFARVYELADTGTLTISGGRSLDVVGQATTPEYFNVAPEGEVFMSEASFAGVFTTLETAQSLAGLEGSVNDAVLTLAPGADRGLVAGEIEAALTSAGIGANVTTRDENLSYKSLNADVENDQAMFNALAFLLFAGAVVAAFILIHRLAQQQRREIGVSMALGVRPGLIALRPLLISAQIALLGVVLGIGVGLLLGRGFKSLLEGFIPLPAWQTPFQTGVFATVAVVGFLLPFLATVIPVWSAVRVAPVDAIKPTHLTAPVVDVRHRGHTHLNTFLLMPFRNLRRSPWRSAFTTLAIAFVLTGLVAFLGIMDSILGAIDVAEREAAGTAPDRIEVALDSFYPVTAPQVEAINGSSTVAEAEPALRFGAAVSTDAGSFSVLLELVDLHDGLWRPTIVEGAIDDVPGLVLAEKAAGDLGVGVGDTVMLRHPALAGGITIVETPLPVLALHPHPIRSYAYMDISNAGMMGLTGITNLIQVDPVAGTTAGDVQRQLFNLDAVASVQSVTASSQAVRDQMNEFVGIIQMMAFAVLAMALLIAFLTASISLDARAREHATMFAFGVRVRTALRMAITESLVMGIVATALGVAGGLFAVWWILTALVSSTLPEFGLDVLLRLSTVIMTVTMGVAAVAIAPLFNLRRMRRMDLPGTLRLVE